MIGIKQPYLKLSFSGELMLRNDNPKNVLTESERIHIALLKGATPTAINLKEAGNQYFKAA